MRKYCDKLLRKIRINKNLFTFLLIIVIIGLAAGSIYSIILDSNDKSMVLNYLNHFFDDVKSNKLNYENAFFNSSVMILSTALLIWILGLSVIGFFIILFIIFLKAFVVGFSFSSIIINFKLKGILWGIIYVFPHQVISLLIFIVLSAYGLIFSFKIIKSLKNKKGISFKNLFNRYVLVLFFSIIVLILTIIYEIYIVPMLLSLTF